MQKHFDENKEKISAGERGALEDALKEARTTLDANREATDAEVFKGMFEHLEKASHKIAEVLYKAAGNTDGAQTNTADGQPGSDEAGKKDDVIDAEYAA